MDVSLWNLIYLSCDIKELNYYLVNPVFRCNNQNMKKYFISIIGKKDGLMFVRTSIDMININTI